MGLFFTLAFFCVLFLQYELVQNFCIRFFKVSLDNNSRDNIHRRTMYSLVFIDCVCFWFLVCYGLSYDINGRGKEAFPLFYQLCMISERENYENEREKATIGDCSKYIGETKKVCLEGQKQVLVREIERNKKYPIAEVIYNNISWFTWAIMIILVIRMILSKE